MGRVTPLYRAERLAEAVGLGTVYLKREDLCHTGAHKINNTLGQCLLAKRMGKKRVIAETGAGQHGVATATAAALMDLECAVFMGVEDIRRQSLNVYKMRLLGAEVIPVDEGTGTLADAVTAALRHWVERVEDTFYVLGSAVGPHPYPMMVRDFQSVIGLEIIDQLQARGVGTSTPSSRASAAAATPSARSTRSCSAETARQAALVGAEAAGLGIDTDKTGASMTLGSPGRHARLLQLPAPRRGRQPARGLLHLSRTRLSRRRSGARLLQGRGYGPLRGGHRRRGARRVCAAHGLEGIIPAIESSHALALLPRLAEELGPDAVVVVTVSGRGDKDIDIVREAGLGVD